MPFIGTYAAAMRILNDIEKGKCTQSCRSIWTRNIKYALKTETNPLHLNQAQRKSLIHKLNQLKGKRIAGIDGYGPSQGRSVSRQRKRRSGSRRRSRSR